MEQGLCHQEVLTMIIIYIKSNVPIDVKASIVTPYFGNPGLGTQYRFSEPIFKLIEKGILVRVP